MIDHVSLGVRDLAESAQLYAAMLGALGHVQLVSEERTVGFGKRYPELWLNLRPDLVRVKDSGTHVCLRASSKQAVDAFYEAALSAGARGAGAPGVRPEYADVYYAAFVLDFDDNLVEAVTFLQAEP
jgi:catechol 2,3-dioxygenase-like lactoylglutathione lyase family enzyme